MGIMMPSTTELELRDDCSFVSQHSVFRRLEVVKGKEGARMIRIKDFDGRKITFMLTGEQVGQLIGMLETELDAAQAADRL